MSPTEGRSPTCPVSTSEDKSREIVDFLLDEGEQTALLDAIAIDTDVDDIDDVTGWGCSVSLPRPPLNEARRTTLVVRKRSVKQNQPEMDLANMRVRCVSEDYAGDHQKSVWKANVEPGTYRYISNNGIYRSTKFASIGSDWVTAKRSRHVEHNTTKPELKQAQRSLMRDLDQHFKSSENVKNDSADPSILGQRSNQTRQEPGSKVTSLANAESDSLPPPSRPAKDPKLVKSASDLFVENFSTRISALEKSEKETNSSTSGPRTPCSPQKPSMSSSNQSTNRRQHDGHAFDTAKMVGQVDDISKDVFTVRPVTRAPDQPLGPLEKLTPKQKFIERAGGSECSSHQSQSQPESPSLPTSFMTAMTAFAQLHNRPTDKNNNNRSKHSTYSKYPYKSSSMSNVSDTESLNSVRNALTLTNSNIERMRMGSYGKNPVKDYGRFLATKPKPAPHSTSISSYNRGNIGGSGFGGAGVAGNTIHRKGVMGYNKSLSTSAPVAFGSTTRPPQYPSNHVPSMMATSTLNVDETSCGLSDTSESYLSGTSLSVNRGSGTLVDGKNGGMALPEISGKRLAVTTTTQRML